MTGINATELQMQRRLTQAFIAADAQQVVLTRTVETPDGEGGVVRSGPVALPAQTMRIIPAQDGTPGGQTRFTADGQEVRPAYTLMGPHTADMQRWDTFETVDGRFEVVFVNANRQYEVKGEVAYRGR